MRENKNLKVFGWTGSAPSGFDVPGRHHDRQEVRVIVAAPSRAAALRAAGLKTTGTWVRDFVSQTGNEQEIAVATAKPGAVFMGPSHRHDQFVEVPQEVIQRWS